MGCCVGSPPPVDLYALVTYLPNPLGSFLNALRQELVPACHLRAHVTVLPPRQLHSQASAWDRLQSAGPDFSPIDIELGDIEVFARTSVIYASIRRGMPELIELHRHLAQGALAFDEPYPYHPHVTLAQGLTDGPLDRAFSHARERWREFQGSRSFVLDAMTFVQSVGVNHWVDLGEVALNAVRA